ncbi:MAG: NAD(P)/FAD-dependent oxidoreductase [Deltaproteobacteria bacterium]|nr:NAD(P)/FAD-dependent oxidoreductase [Deltaproteobacteria bacterium]
MKDFVIIGAGKAGLSAAIYAAKVKRQVSVLTKKDSHDRNGRHWFVPGLTITAPDHLKNLRAEAEKLGVKIIEEEVVQATLGTSEKKIMTSSKRVWDASAVILASGCETRKGPIDGEEKFVGCNIHYNIYQEGLYYDGKTVLVEGKNEEAIRDVLSLSRFAQKIYFVVPAMKLDGDQKLLERVKNESKIEVLLSSSIKKMEGSDVLKTVTVLSQGEEKKLEIDGAFLLARQSLPQYDYVRGTISISPEGCVLVDDRFMTSIPGVFCCGDMVAGVPQSPFISMAQGFAAAMQADRYLSQL